MVPYDTVLVSDMVGIGGALLYATADLLLATRRLSSDGFGFFVISLCAALMIVASLLVRPNPGALLSELFFVIICLAAIYVRLKARAARRA
ncbi:MAG: hypothetical protein AAGH83_02835 [Pseudomonadota bacterium]